MNTKSVLPELEYSEATCWESLYRFSSNAVRKRLKLAITEIAGASCLAAGSTDTLGFNRVIGLGISSPLNSGILNTIIDFFNCHDVPRFFVQLPPFRLTTATKQILQQEGFKHYNNWSKYFRDLKKAGTIPIPSTRFRVAPVKPSQLDLFGDIICQSFEFKPAFREFMSSTYGNRGWKYYFALDKEEPVAAASLCISENHAKLVLGATLPKARNAGAQSLLIAKRIHEAISHGCHTISTETPQDLPDSPSYSARNMQKFGFELGYHRANYIYEF